MLIYRPTLVLVQSPFHKTFLILFLLFHCYVFSNDGIGHGNLNLRTSANRTSVKNGLFGCVL